MICMSLVCIDMEEGGKGSRWLLVVDHKAVAADLVTSRGDRRLWAW